MGAILRPADPPSRVCRVSLARGVAPATMGEEMKNQVLACKPAIGAVSRCSHGCIHLQVGRVIISLMEDEYMVLVALINDSAANYELLRHREDRPCGLDEEDFRFDDIEGEPGCEI